MIHRVPGCEFAGKSEVVRRCSRSDHKGFGSKLIEVSLEKSEVVFAPEGVSCVLEITL